MLKTINLFIFCLFSTYADSQDLAGDLALIVSAFDSSEQVTLKASYSVQSKKGGSYITKGTSSIERDSSTMHTILGQQEYFVDFDYNIMVDHEEKTIAIIKSEDIKQEKIDNVDFDGQKLMEMVKPKNEPLTPQINFEGESDGIKTYSLKPSKGDLKECQIKLNMSKNAIDNISYEYKTKSSYSGMFVLVKYTDFKLNSVNPDHLSRSMFFTIENGDYKLADKYRNYTLFSE